MAIRECTVAVLIALFCPATILVCVCVWCRLQVLSTSSVSSGVGVYWMFYSGGDYEAVPAPQGLPGAEAGNVVEGLRMRPGLAMSQVRHIISYLCICIWIVYVSEKCSGY